VSLQRAWYRQFQIPLLAVEPESLAALRHDRLPSEVTKCGNTTATRKPLSIRLNPHFRAFSTVQHPITGIAGCCALSASGHAAAPPPGPGGDLAPFTVSMGSPSEPPGPAFRRLSMPWKPRQVLGLDLNRSEIAG